MELNAEFWFGLLQIIYVNIILSGDNAVVIALACRGLPKEQQKWGVMLGAGAAVVLRIIFTVFIAYLLTIPYLKVAGGLLLFYIGYKLMMPQDEGDDVDAASSLFAAVRIVLIADAVMSLDNVIAVAAAANGNYVLLILGLIISVPLVVYGATLLITLINRFPVIVPGGAALIGFIAADIIQDDPSWRAWIDAHVAYNDLLLPLIGAIAVVAAGRIVAPHGPTGQGVAEEAAAGAGISLFAQVLPRLLLVALSLGGYEVGQEMGGDMPDDATGVARVLLELRPIFAAVVAIVVGECVGWAVRRAKGDAKMA
jgi:YjbE family integral membrane protein